MSQRYDDSLGVVVVPAEVSGPSGNVVLRLAVDTGATQTMINVGSLAVLGYHPSPPDESLPGISRFAAPQRQ